jgi:hypothetical protein
MNSHVQIPSKASRSLALVNQPIFGERLLEIIPPSSQIWVCIGSNISVRGGHDK